METPKRHPRTAQQRAVEHLRNAATIKLELDDLRAIKSMPRPVLAIERSSAEMRLSLKLAEIEATLAVAEAFREWTNVGREGLEAAPLQLIPSPEGDVTSLRNFPAATPRREEL